MTCAECLAALETGNFWERSAARRHAAGCPACAEAVQALAAIKGQLAATQPLADVQRRGWLAVASAEVVRVKRTKTAWSRGVLGAACTAAALLIATGVWYGWRTKSTTDIAPRDVPGLSASSQDVSLVIEPNTEIREGLLRLSQQLDLLSRQAALLDEQRRVGELLGLSP